MQSVKSVKETILNGKQGIAKINTIDLEAGIYFYSFSVDDEIMSAEKLVISH